MARPTKSAAVLTECSQTKAEIEYRMKQEEILRGASEINTPEYLNANQRAIFDYIVAGLKDSGILSGLDVYILTECVIAIDRMQYIEQQINEKPDIIEIANFAAVKDRYFKAFVRCANELSLSPQSRAKMANIRLQNELDKEDPLKAALRGEGEADESGV